MVRVRISRTTLECRYRIVTPIGDTLDVSEWQVFFQDEKIRQGDKVLLTAGVVGRTPRHVFGKTDMMSVSLMNILKNLQIYYAEIAETGKTPEIVLSGPIIKEIDATLLSLLGNKKEKAATIRSMHHRFAIRRTLSVHPGTPRKFRWYVPSVEWRNIARPVPWSSHPTWTNRTLSMQGRICFEHTTDAYGMANLPPPHRVHGGNTDGFRPGSMVRRGGGRPLRNSGTRPL